LQIIKIDSKLIIIAIVVADVVAIAIDLSKKEKKGFSKTDKIFEPLKNGFVLIDFSPVGK